jgi:Amt family ammonium transporter
VCGLWGAIAAGLFAVDGVGLFYGGGPDQLLLQLCGVGAILAWTVTTMSAVFYALNKIFGLRAKTADELQGLDSSEHGLVSAYADFLAAPDTSVYYMESAPVPPVVLESPDAAQTPLDAAPAPAGRSGTGSTKKFSKVEIITRPQLLEPLKLALESIGVTGMSVTNVVGHGLQKGQVGSYRGVAIDAPFVPKVKVETVVSLVPVRDVIATAKKVLHTGAIGDGKIFVTDVQNVVKIRTGEEGYAALQDYVE